MEWWERFLSSEPGSVLGWSVCEIEDFPWAWVTLAGQACCLLLVQRNLKSQRSFWCEWKDWDHLRHREPEKILDRKQPPHWHWDQLACPQLLRATSDGMNLHWRRCWSLLDTRYFHTSASFPFIFHQPCEAGIISVRRGGAAQRWTTRPSHPAATMAEHSRAPAQSHSAQVQEDVPETSEGGSPFTLTWDFQKGW